MLVLGGGYSMLVPDLGMCKALGIGWQWQTESKIYFYSISFAHPCRAPLHFDNVDIPVLDFEISVRMRFLLH